MVQCNASRWQKAKQAVFELWDGASGNGAGGGYAPIQPKDNKSIHIKVIGASVWWLAQEKGCTLVESINRGKNYSVQLHARPVPQLDMEQLSSDISHHIKWAKTHRPDVVVVTPGAVINSMLKGVKPDAAFAKFSQSLVAMRGGLPEGTQLVVVGLTEEKLRSLGLGERLEPAKGKQVVESVVTGIDRRFEGVVKSLRESGNKNIHFVKDYYAPLERKDFKRGWFPSVINLYEFFKYPDKTSQTYGDATFGTSFFSGKSNAVHPATDAGRQKIAEHLLKELMVKDGAVEAAHQKSEKPDKRTKPRAGLGQLSPSMTKTAVVREPAAIATLA